MEFQNNHWKEDNVFLLFVLKTKKNKQLPINGLDTCIDLKVVLNHKFMHFHKSIQGCVLLIILKIIMCH